MIDAGADVKAKDAIGRTPLHYLAQADKMGNTMKWFIEHDKIKGKFDVNAATESGVTSLMLAVKLNNRFCVAGLLEAEANPFLVDQMGNTA